MGHPKKSRNAVCCRRVDLLARESQEQLHLQPCEWRRKRKGENPVELVEEDEEGTTSSNVFVPCP